MTEKKYSSSSSYRSASDRDGARSGSGYGASDRGGYAPRSNGYSNGGSYGGSGGYHRGGGGGGSYAARGGFGGNSFNRARPQPPPPPAELSVYKTFYKEHPKTANRQRYEIQKWTADNQVTFRGHNLLNPIIEFDELTGLPEDIMYSIRKQGFTAPTVIQSAAWPFALSGRDIVGIAQTGSGKTLGYTLPALVHVDGNQHRASYGPSVLVLAPTRELAQQIKEVVAVFKSARCVCIFGGASKGGQRRELERVQPSIIIACPGRLIDFVEEGAISLANITYLVLDEADRMLDMGFEPQIRKIVDRIPKTRQTLMWSATWPREVRKLAEDFLIEYTQVNIGSTNLAANHNITQIVDVCMEMEKFDKLYKLMHEVSANNKENKMIIFAETKRKVDELSIQIRNAGWYAGAIHGDKPQQERDWVLNDFRNSRTTILIATDVAARGLGKSDASPSGKTDWSGISFRID